MTQIEDEMEAQSGAEGTKGVQHQRADKRSTQNAPGERVNAHAAGQQYTAKDDACVVDERRDCLVEKYLAHQ